MSIIYFANLKFRGLTRSILLKDDPFLKIVVTMNAELIVKAHSNPALNSIVNLNYATFDGRIPELLARFKNPGATFEKISGSDFIYDVAAFCQKKSRKIFLLGGTAESNCGAVEKLKSRFQIEVEGYSPPFAPFPFEHDLAEDIRQRIIAFKPDYIFVGFGAVKQELWIQHNMTFLQQLGVKIAVGSGGTFDFVAGTVKRAPVFIQKMGLEGVYRLIQEPKLFRFKRLLYSLQLFFYS